MVGDSSSDVEPASVSGFAVIGCAYAAYGKEEELDGADALISGLPALIGLLEGIPTGR